MKNEKELVGFNPEDGEILISKKTKEQNTLGNLFKICIYIFFIFLFLAIIIYLFAKKIKIGTIVIQDKNFIKPLGDDRKYRVVHLVNGLDALIISDPKTSNSAASMSVGVGSAFDPENSNGLAHFCEHMLFLGSKSFPNFTDFEDYLTSHSGYNNAFTELEKTTYYFQIDNIGFDKALNMFGKMMAEPVFNMNLMDKEINAVNSEHEKNYNSDIWRKRQILRSLSKDNSPYKSFSTGNNETLRQIPSSELNKALNDFFNKYYKSHNMKLAIITNKTLDDIQETVEKYFSDIKMDSHIDLEKNDENKTNLFGSAFKEKPFDSKILSKIVWYKKISSGESIDLYFQLKSSYPDYKIKSMDYVDYLIKYAGDKSLLNILQKRNLANKIETGYAETLTGFSIYCITIEVTNEGLKNYDFIIKMVFNYINMIKNNKISESTYEEIKKIYDLNFKFSEKQNDNAQYLSLLSGNMFIYEFQDIIYGDFIHSYYNPRIIMDSIADLNIDNSIIFINSKDEPKKFEKLEIIKEKYYNAEYKIMEFNETLKKNLSAFPVYFDLNENIDGIKSFRLRENNEFISQVKELQKSCFDTKVICMDDEYDNNNSNLTPITLYFENNFKAFYKIDNTFQVPKVEIKIRVTSSYFKTSSSDYTNLMIFSNYLEYLYISSLADAIDTGNIIQLEFTNQGIYFYLNCFSDVCEKILNLVINELFKFQPDKNIYNKILEFTKKKQTDNTYTKPYNKNNFYFNKLMKYNVTIYTECLNELNKISFEDFVTLTDKFRKELLIDILFYGSIDRDDVKKIADNVKSYLTTFNISQDVLKSEYFIQNSIHIQRLLDNPIIYQYQSEVHEEKNHAVTELIQIGKKTDNNYILLSTVEKCLGNLFFYNLRTVQQLGYIAAANSYDSNSILYYKVLVQGSKKNPRDIDKAINEVFDLATEKINECKDNIEVVKLSIKEKILKNEENLGERAKKIWKEIDYNTYNFNNTQSLLDELENVNSNSLTSFFYQNIKDNKRKLSLHHYSGNYENYNTTITNFTNNNDHHSIYTSDLQITKSLKFIHAYNPYQVKNRKNKANKIKDRKKIVSSSYKNNFNKIKH